MDYRQTLLNMSPETRDFTNYWRGKRNRTVLLTIRVTPEERDAVRAAAEWEHRKVAKFIRAAIAARARDGYCNAAAEPADTTAE